jgi:cyclin H
VTIPSVPKIPGELQKNTLQKEMLALPIISDGEPSSMTLDELEKRLSNAYAFAAHVLHTIAILADVYFLDTPSHIWLSAHFLADEPVTLFYLGTKAPISSPLYSKLLSTVRSCASIILHTHIDIRKTR